MKYLGTNACSSQPSNESLIFVMDEKGIWQIDLDWFLKEGMPDGIHAACPCCIPNLLKVKLQAEGIQYEWKEFEDLTKLQLPSRLDVQTAVDEHLTNPIRL